MGAEQNARSIATEPPAIVQLACKGTPSFPAQRLAVEPALSVQTMKSAKTESASGSALHPHVLLVPVALPGTTRRFALVTLHSREMVSPIASPQSVR